eukprot:5093260-Prymnesium_polylepis.1
MLAGTTLLLVACAEGLSLFSPVRSARPLLASAAHALHHVLEAPAARLSSTQLEELSNAAVPSSEPGRDVLAYVARPTAPPARPLPVLVLIH